MLRISAFVALALVLAVPATAQSIGEPLPGRPGARDTFKPAQSSQAKARPCPEYGPGFVRVEGSSACVRVGGAVRAEFGKSSRNGTGSAVGGMAYIESRSETSVGSLRTVIQAHGQLDRNLPSSSPYRY